MNEEHIELAKHWIKKAYRTLETARYNLKYTPNPSFSYKEVENLIKETENFIKSMENIINQKIKEMEKK